MIYFTLCRFDDFKRLTDKEVTDEGSYIKLVLRHSKNDQFGDNSISVIPIRTDSPACPVRLIQLYFQRFGLWFGGSGKLLNPATQGEGQPFSSHTIQSVSVKCDKIGPDNFCRNMSMILPRPRRRALRCRGQRIFWTQGCRCHTSWFSGAILLSCFVYSVLRC